MYRLFLWTTLAEIGGTIFETILIFWLWGTLWSKWTLPFKIATPILHALFSAAQLFGAWVFWSLARKEKAKMHAMESGLVSQRNDDSNKVSEQLSEEGSSKEKALIESRCLTKNACTSTARDRDDGHEDKPKEP
jgi:hypothetical protein